MPITCKLPSAFQEKKKKHSEEPKINNQDEAQKTEHSYDFYYNKNISY